MGFLTFGARAQVVPRRPAADVLVLLVLGAALSAVAAARPISHPRDLSQTPPLRSGSSATHDGSVSLPVAFVPNRGQMDPRVSFSLTRPGASLFFTSRGVTFLLSNGNERSVGAASPRRWVIREHFVGANPGVIPTGVRPNSERVSYFEGPESQWRTGIRAFEQLVYHDLWPGIDLAYSGADGRLKYTFLVHSGADPAKISLAYQGITSLSIDRSGRLRIGTPAGRLVEDRPYAYQIVGDHRVTVSSAFAAGPSSGRYSFSVGRYDASRTLVIDPAVYRYSGYIGGSGSDKAYRITVDASGAVYVGGSTDSAPDTFPLNVGPYMTLAGGTDAFVGKLNPQGTGFDYLGYIGGSRTDVVLDIKVDAAGDAYVTGSTASPDFPVAVGPDLQYNGGNFDAWVAKIDPTGTQLLYSGFIGGDRHDEGLRIALDQEGAAYVGGFTTSSESTFPAQVGPVLTFSGGPSNQPDDGFVAKVRPDGTGLLYAGYVGGYGRDVIRGIAVDGSGDAYVAGETQSDQSTFPVAGGLDQTYSGEFDAFVGEVPASGIGFKWLGYLGGSGFDRARGLALDADGNVYIAGDTGSATDFPVMVGPDLTYNGGSHDAFVAKIASDGSARMYTGFIGGDKDDADHTVAVDSSGAAYVVGFTKSMDSTFSTLDFPQGASFGGSGDGFIAKVLPSGQGLAYAGFVGGTGADITLSVSVDPNGNAYVGGATASRDFPVTVGPDLAYNGGEEDAYVAKIGFELGVSITSGPSDPTNQTTASFEFSADVVDPTFRCSLDGAALTTCTSPAGYSGLSDGEHSFVVEETDQSGDSTSATWNWRVETVPPTITSFTPAEGSVGKHVTINGSGFLAATGVSFGGVSALFSIISENQIQATVPKGALTGPITVSNPAGGATSTTAFRVRPTIKSFTPTTGPAGTSVVINGSAFTGAINVLFNGVSAVFTVNSYSQITATVPAGATTGPITVVTPSGKDVSKTSFTVT